MAPVVVGAMTCCAFLHSICNLKAAQINMQCSLIWEFMIYKFKLGHHISQVTKNICLKSECEIDHSAVSRRFKKFCSSYKNHNNQIRSGSLKTVDSEDVNQVSSTWRVSGKLSISCCGVLPLQPQQKHPELLDWASHYQNIAKLLTHPCHGSHILKSTTILKTACTCIKIHSHK